MKAILCKIIPATDTKPTRIKVQAEGLPAITKSKDHWENEDITDPHKAAALHLCAKYGWATDVVGGVLPNGDRVFCFVPRVYIDIVASFRENVLGTAPYDDAKARELLVKLDA